jgi:hypothetical protein
MDGRAKNRVETAFTYRADLICLPQLACICKVFARVRRAKSVCQQSAARENPAISMSLSNDSMTLGAISTTVAMIATTLGTIPTTLEMISRTLAAVATTVATVPTVMEMSDRVLETPTRVMEMPPSRQLLGDGSPF